MNNKDEEKLCKQCNDTFSISENDYLFYQKISPKIGEQIFSIPTPTLCPTCRSQRRLAYRNDRSLYKTQCHKTKKSIISMYNPEKELIIYDQKERWKDEWDPFQYGKEIDFNRSFFEQWYELKKIVPRFNLFNLDTENCEYVNYAPHCKNCYLLFGSWLNESCFFSQTLNECKNCLDSLFLDKSEFCYENIDCNNNYEGVNCQNCNNLLSSYFCFDCKNCQNCIGCFNLQNKNYHIFNKPVSKEEFENLKLKMGSYQYFQEFKEKSQKYIRENAIFLAFVGFNNENVSGNLIFNSKNAKYCFSVYNSENVAFCARMLESKDVYDFDGGGKSELLYENMSNDFSYQCMGCTTCEHLNNAYYCDLCFNSEHLFGCVGLKNNKKYCILNKQYSKEDYEEIVPKIIRKMMEDKEWGEFPKISQSPFEYKETMAQEYFPIKSNDLKNNMSLQEVQRQIPDNIKDIQDDICDKVLQCEITGKSYKIIPQELEFYKKMNLPIPRKHPDQRHYERMQLRNPRKLWNGNCNKCNK
ncbi:MAG: hypothetical protein WCL18_08390 [bacterium]